MAVATAVVAYDDAELLDIACVTTTLATATSFVAGQHPTGSPPNTAPDTAPDGPGYAVRLLSPAAGRCPHGRDSGVTGVIAVTTDLRQ